MLQEIDEANLNKVIETYIRKLKPETYMEARGIRYTLVELGLATEQELDEAAGDLVARKYHGEHI
jgi:hypothetical protein